MAAVKRIALYWKRDCKTDYQRQLCWYTTTVEHEKPIEEVIVDIVKRNNWGCLESVDDRSQFLQDALVGKVVVVEGKNIKGETFEDNKTYVYGNDMHSVNNYKAWVETKTAGTKGGYRYGFKFVFTKERALNEDEMELVKALKSAIEHKIANNKVFHTFCLLLMSEHMSNKTPIYFDASEKGEYGISDERAMFDTKDCHTFKSAEYLTDTIERMIRRSYERTKEICGCGLKYDNTILDDGSTEVTELPEVFMSSRCLYNAALDRTGELKGTAEDRIKYCLENKIMNHIFSLKSGWFREYFVDRVLDSFKDDTTIILKNCGYPTNPNDINLEEYQMEDIKYLLDLQDSIIVLDEDNDRHPIRNIILYGNSKTLYETFGKKEFFNIVRNSQH